jgi:hypothetical protein
MTPLTKLGLNKVPVPANVASAVDQDERRHHDLPLSRPLNVKGPRLSLHLEAASYEVATSSSCSSL